MKKALSNNTVIKRVSASVSKYIGAWLLIVIILCVAFWIRIQSVDAIPGGQFIANDAYFYYWQAQIVSEQGFLPARDMDRWVPLGRDNTQLLPLYTYAVAYIHKAITFLFPNISLYHVLLYAPVFCFVIGLGAFCIFLYRTFGVLFSSTVGILLATLPGMIQRSTAGFSDRDSWCLMLGIIAVITYLAALQMSASRKRVIFTIASGITCFLGGMSWEGFGVFVSIILFVEICRFLGSEADEDLRYYLLWVSTFVPALFVVSPVYRSGEWFAQHLSAFVLIPPLVLLLIRYIRHYLTIKDTLAEKLRPHARNLSLILTLISLTVGVFYILSQLETFELTALPLSQNRLMDTVGELMSPEYRYWIFRYGSVFFLGCIGLMMASIRLWDKKSLVLISALTLFTVTTFFRVHIDKLCGGSISNIVFFVSIAGTVLGLLLVTWLRKEEDQYENYFIAFTIWFLYWIALSRDAIRYDFFIGLPIAFFTAAIFRFVSESLCVKLNIQGAWQIFVKTGITVTLLAVLMFMPHAGAHAKRSIFSASHVEKDLSDYSSRSKMFRWMQTTLPDNACVAASWSYGSQLNVLGGVKTIIDQDHYIQHWIHLFFRHVFCGQSTTEALEFLKTHEATHLMLRSEELFLFAKSHSSVGSDEKGDREYQLKPLKMGPYINGKYTLVPVDRDARFIHIGINSNGNDNSLITTTMKLKNGDTIEIPYTLFIGKTRVQSQKKSDLEPGGIILMFNEQKRFRKGYYIPPIGWNSLAVRLFFREEVSDIFVPVYPEDGDVTARVKVWEIHYPPEIKPNPKYIETKPSE